jgi:hypothetical protein
MNVRRIVAVIAISAAGIGGLAACGGNTPAHTSVPASSTSAATRMPRAVQAAPSAPAVTNPVTILRETGAKVSPGSVNGDPCFGNMCADGEFDGAYGSEDVSVDVFPDAATMKSEFPTMGISMASDDQHTIVGPDWAVTIQPATALDGSQFPVSAEVIAQRTGGKVFN